MSGSLLFQLIFCLTPIRRIQSPGCRIFDACLIQRGMLPLKDGNMIVHSDGVVYKMWQSQHDLKGEKPCVGDSQIKLTKVKISESGLVPIIKLPLKEVQARTKRFKQSPLSYITSLLNNHLNSKQQEERSMKLYRQIVRNGVMCYMSQTGLYVFSLMTSVTSTLLARRDKQIREAKYRFIHTTRMTLLICTPFEARRAKVLAW